MKHINIDASCYTNIFSNFLYILIIHIKIQILDLNNTLMEDNFLDLIHKNLYCINTVKISNDIKTGLFYDNLYNSIEYKYLKNLCSETPASFEADGVESIFTKICMMFSYNDYSYLKDNILIEHELKGVIPRNDSNPVLFVQLKDVESKEGYLYKTKKYTFDFKINKLNIDEQLKLIFNMIRIYKIETNLYLRNLKVNAYLDRLFFSENDKHPLISRIVRYYYSLVNDDYSILEKVSEKSYIFSLHDLLKFPLVFRRDIELQLGFLYSKYACYEKAFKIFNVYSIHQEAIDCLISLHRKEEAIEKIKEELKKLEGKKEYNNIVLYSNYCIKLGWITNDVGWFDVGHKVYGSFEPLEQKARFYYKLKKYIEAKNTYKKVLQIVPNNEKILFAFASVKIILKEYNECIDIFKRLIEIDKRNPDYHRNLALCHYFIDNLNISMNLLKQNAIKDLKSMEMYFKLVLKNKDKNEILWCISKIDDIKFINFSVDYLLNEQILTKKEVLQAIKKNPRLEKLEI